MLKTTLTRSRGWIASIAILACLTMTGTSFGTQSNSEFVEVEVALENAIAGSGSGSCIYFTKGANSADNSYCCMASCNELDTCSVGVNCP